MRQYPIAPDHLAKLDVMGTILDIPIPDVTQTGRTPLSTTWHAVHEAQELKALLERGGGCGGRQALEELVDLYYISLSAINQYANNFGYDKEKVIKVIMDTIQKNLDRGYYNCENPVDSHECGSESSEFLKEKRRKEEEWEHGGFAFDVGARQKKEKVVLYLEDLCDYVKILEEALAHIEYVMDTQVAEDVPLAGRFYSMSPGGYGGIMNSIRLVRKERADG